MRHLKRAYHWFTAPDSPDDKLLNAAKRIGILIPVAAVAWAGLSFLGSGPSSRPTMPDTVGMTQASAEARLEDAGIADYTIDSTQSETVDEGRVISQTPAPSTQVTDSTQVTILISTGGDPDRDRDGVPNDLDSCPDDNHGAEEATLDGCRPFARVGLVTPVSMVPNEVGSGHQARVTVSYESNSRDALIMLYWTVTGGRLGRTSGDLFTGTWFGCFPERLDGTISNGLRSGTITLGTNCTSIYGEGSADFFARVIHPEPLSGYSPHIDDRAILANELVGQPQLSLDPIPSR